MMQRPIVDWRIAGPGVEGENRRLSGAEPGDVGDAADIEDGERLLVRSGERGMIERHERRALAAGSDVGGAKIADHVDAGEADAGSAPPQPPGPPLPGRTKTGVALEADT